MQDLLFPFTVHLLSPPPNSSSSSFFPPTLSTTPREYFFFYISLPTNITPNQLDDMPQRVLLILFPLLALFFHLSSALVAMNPYYRNCSGPFHCSGSNINVSFPFSLPNSPSYCGVPGYELSCSDDAKSEPSISLDGVNYRVKDIDYDQGFLTLVESNFLQGNSCPQTFANASINSTLFDVADLDVNLTVYINCSNPIPGLMGIICFNDPFGPYSYYKLDKGPPSFLLDMFGGCQLKAAVPLDEMAAMLLNSNSSKFGDALKQGFRLKWTAGKDWCRGCIDSGGVCGYNSTRASDPICFCPNNTTLGSCPYERTTDYHYLQNCRPKSCGNLTNVTFPFWLRELQPDYCGLPSFELLCEDETPKLIMAPEEYHVLDISYDRRTATVSLAKFAAKNNCFLPFHGLSFALTPFSISSLNRELLFVYNCTETRGGFLEINCHGNKSYAYLGGAYGMQDSEDLIGSCYTVVRPVLSYLGANVKLYPELLANGFLLNWTAPDCSTCLRSRGQCGYNNDTRNFMCICGDRAHSKSCKGSSKTGLIIGLSTAGGFSFIMFCSLCFLIYRRWKKKQSSSSSNFLDRSPSSAMSSKIDPELGSSVYTPIFSYDELYEATNAFDASEELGDGGFGTVYKGKLKDGRVVAVKRLYESNYRRAEQFMNEVKIVSLLRHQNLVCLYGCTSRHSRELLLVYEFIPNGTVADHLHGSRASESFLPWNVRMNIAIETADALNYLHSVEPQIIHRDIKTNNIMLDNSFHVKVGDFGLSRLFPLDATHVSTAPQGTPGYVDPEYHKFFQLTDKSDVYSFGVVLMELISSMPAVDINRKFNEANLAYMAIKKIQRQELHELVDPRLGYHTESNINSMITQVAELALQCLQSEREMRPAIKVVLEILREIEKAGFKTEDCMKVADAVKEEACLLKNIPPYSPNSVADRWVSTSSSISSFSG
ncbi:hypothetical protein IEQ34_013746 [Dendrobium chrysotoxum]|uniref:Protein kinase domain-containing protein n=1 Tax=Dendrobium chrysotoxum TaxID=161865 RepID=A0AAV7GPB9_DENCH|nr:hypothetical protein IEQ34_013746 [Dendrobium chrysotoxum]